MKLAVYLLLCSTLSLLAGENWPGVDFVEVRAYAWRQSKDKDYRHIILDDMTFVPGVINPDGAVLTPEEVNRLRAPLTGNHPGYTRAMCYVPHNAFVFYDAAKKPVAFLEICFSCYGTRPFSIKGVSHSVDLPALASIFAAHKLPLTGQADVGVQADAELFKKNFDSHIVEATSPSTKK